MAKQKQSLLIWNDEEPQYQETTSAHLKQRSWVVRVERDPDKILDIVRSLDSNLGRAVLVVDLMMPYARNSKYFNALTTQDGFLTGLRLLRILDEEQLLGKFIAVVVYSVIVDSLLRQPVNAWIEDVSARVHATKFRFIAKTEVLYHQLPDYIEALAVAKRD